MNEHLRDALVASDGPLAGESIVAVDSVGGGCIHQAWRLKLEDGRALFAKGGASSALALLNVEAEALKALHRYVDPDVLVVPQPLAVQELNGWSVLLLPWLDLRRGDQAALGRGLALMHRSSAEASDGQFGWHRDGFIGAGPQPGGWCNDWGRCFVDLRLRPQLEMASHWGIATEQMERLLTALVGRLNDHQPQPSLVHGDLWGGNAGCLGDGRGTVYDPAAWWADREVDLAMTRLFGGFSSTFHEAYAAVLPPRSGHQDRSEIYNLYHLLNHANLFGGGYIDQCRAGLKRLARQLL